MSIRDSMMAALALRMQQQREQDQQTLAGAAQQPIPGMTGPTTPMVGMAPPQQQMPMPQQIAGHHMMTPPFATSGPYGQQALRLAGLLGNPQFNPPGNIQTQQGLLGAPPKGFRVPFYRPPGK